MAYKQKSLEEQWGKSHIIGLFYEHRGKLSHVAKALGCASSAVYRFVETVDGARDALEESRRYALDDRLDDCETYAETIAERYEDDTTNGLKAAIYFLNTHGGHRGYGKDQVKEDGIGKKADTISQYVEMETARNDAE